MLPDGTFSLDWENWMISNNIIQPPKTAVTETKVRSELSIIIHTLIKKSCELPWDFRSENETSIKMTCMHARLANHQHAHSCWWFHLGLSNITCRASVATRMCGRKCAHKWVLPSADMYVPQTITHQKIFDYGTVPLLFTIPTQQTRARRLLCAGLGARSSRQPSSQFTSHIRGSGLEGLLP